MDLSESVLVQVSAHRVGNKGNGAELVTSKESLPVTKRELELLKTPFLSKFADDKSVYSFSHAASLEYNEIYNFCLESFAGDIDFHENSVRIARHLYESTTHPKIKDGDLYLCLYDNCLYNGKYVEAIGIYKAESKNHFLDLNTEDGNFSFTLREGVDAARFDKGCLIFPLSAEEGFEVLLYDANGKGEEAVFWRETFLNLQPRANEFYQTNSVMTMTREFIAKHAPAELNMAKTDQIDLLNRSVEYFRANESFDMEQFKDEVFHEKGLIQSFVDFGNEFAENNAVDIPESFGISTQAVKKQARVYKSVLKLDHNFHVYIHGDKDLIEKGYDQAVGKHFYKIYFDEEL